MQNKAFLAPVWILLSIVAWEMLASLLSMRMMAVAAVTANATIIFFLFMWPIILLPEVIVYWAIRKRINNRRWVWVHLLFSVAAFVLLKILLIAINLYVGFHYSPVDMQSIIRMANKVHLGTFYAFLIIGHASFVAVLVQAFSNNKQPLPEAAPSGIFDEIH